MCRRVERARRGLGIILSRISMSRVAAENMKHHCDGRLMKVIAFSK